MRNSTLSAVIPFVAIFLPQVANAQCPPLGNDSGCGTIITITDTGATVTKTGQGPYDGSDDTLVGVVNNSRLPIFSLDLSNPASTSNPIFAFDGDGITSAAFGAPGNAKDSTGYGGPNSYFTNINAAQTAGRVNFITPLAPHGGSTYFALESDLGLNATACTSLINNALKTQASGANICATFTPNQGFTLQEAASSCGFVNFDWVQKITKQLDPSEFFARNLNGVFDSSINGPVRLTSKRVQWNDPPQGGGYAQGFGGGATPDNSYPFYYDPKSGELATHQQGHPEPACSLAVTAGMTLSMHDAPSDRCLPGGLDVGTAKCTDAVNAPGATAEPAGSVGGYVTDLAGVNADGTATDLGIGFTWTSNYNGSTGGVVTKKTNVAADNNGTGGATVVSVNQTSTLNGIIVNAVNGSPTGPSALLAAVLPVSRSSTIGSQATGTVTAFATIINTDTVTATNCSIAPFSTLPLTFHFQTTSSTTNSLIGTIDTAVNIPAGGSQSFVIALTPTGAITPTNLQLNFSCTNENPAPINIGLDTLLLSASVGSTPDVIALAATTQNDGIVHVTNGSPLTGSFAVASDNLGASGTITVGTNTGTATLPITVTICQSNSSTGACLQTPSATVTTTISTNATPTFAIFVTASASVPFDPAGNRIFVTFTDSGNAVRGETSVAVETQ